jgi:hypothetical protein
MSPEKGPQDAANLRNFGPALMLICLTAPPGKAPARSARLISPFQNGAYCGFPLAPNPLPYSHNRENCYRRARCQPITFLPKQRLPAHASVAGARHIEAAGNNGRVPTAHDRQLLNASIPEIGKSWPIRIYTVCRHVIVNAGSNSSILHCFDDESDLCLKSCAVIKVFRSYSEPSIRPSAGLDRTKIFCP